MNQRIFALKLLATTALSLGGQGAAMAQDAEGATAAGDIIVTARRVEERLQDVPISITVLNQAQIDERNITSGADLAVYTPSLTVNQRYGPETSSFAIRGFTQETGTQPSVGVFFAEAVTPRSLGGTNDGSNLAAGSFMDLENAQILKGPQGTLFGRNTTGGTILLVPKKPTDRLEGYVEGSLGNYDMRRAQAVLNVPLADTFKVRLGVDRLKRDGYVKNQTDIGPRTLNDSNYFYARLSILAELTPTLENYTIATYSHSDNNGFGARLVTCQRNPALRGGLANVFAPGACAQIDRQAARGDGPFDVENPLEDPFFEIEQWQVINKTTWNVSDSLTIKNIASYAEYVADLNFNLLGENITFLGNPILFANIGESPDGHNSDQYTFSEELQFQGTSANGRLTWQAGGYLEVSRPLNDSTAFSSLFLTCSGEDAKNLQCTDPLRPVFGNFSPAAISDARLRPNFINKAVYAQATYDITDQLALTGGIRYTWDTARVISKYNRFIFPAPNTPVRFCNDTIRLQGPGGGPLFTNNPDDCAETFIEKSKRPTWLINLDYKPTEDILVYAKWARGYRAGGVAPNNVGAEIWQPEKVDSYEIGFKSTFRGAVRGYLNAAAFYNDFTNQQLNATLSLNGTPRGAGILNAGKSEILGAEVDAAVTLFDSLTLALGYTYLDTEIKELVIPPPSPLGISFDPLAIEGDPLVRSPKHRLTLSANYTLPLDESIGEITFGANFVHTDKQLITRNTAPELHFLPASDLLNLNASWTDVMGQPFDLAFFMTNATNEVYPVVVSGSFNSAGFDSVAYGQPRMWGFRLRYKFGN